MDDHETQQHIDDLQKQLDDLKKDLKDVSQEFYKNNFNTSQDFSKYSRFNNRLKVPHYAADPTAGDVGDIVEVGGKLKICTVASSTAPTWVIVGTQS